MRMLVRDDALYIAGVKAPFSFRRDWNLDSNRLRFYPCNHCGNPAVQQRLWCPSRPKFSLTLSYPIGLTVMNPYLSFTQSSNALGVVFAIPMFEMGFGTRGSVLVTGRVNQASLLVPRHFANQALTSLISIAKVGSFILSSASLVTQSSLG